MPCLRALVVLPTRELAAQVHNVIAPLAQAVGLRTGLAAAATSLQIEAAALMATESGLVNTCYLRKFTSKATTLRACAIDAVNLFIHS